MSDYPATAGVSSATLAWKARVARLERMLDVEVISSSRGVSVVLLIEDVEWLAKALADALAGKS